MRDEIKMEAVGMRTFRWMRGWTMPDIIRNEFVRGSFGSCGSNGENEKEQDEMVSACGKKEK